MVPVLHAGTPHRVSLRGFERSHPQLVCVDAEEPPVDGAQVLPAVDGGGVDRQSCHRPMPPTDQPRPADQLTTNDHQPTAHQPTV